MSGVGAPTCALDHFIIIYRVSAASACSLRLSRAGTRSGARTGTRSGELGQEPPKWKAARSPRTAFLSSCQSTPVAVMPAWAGEWSDTVAVAVRPRMVATSAIRILRSVIVVLLSIAVAHRGRPVARSASLSCQSIAVAVMPAWAGEWIDTVAVAVSAKMVATNAIRILRSLIAVLL
jgi:hypothetical protein